MPFIGRRAQLHLTSEDNGYLERLAQSRTEAAVRVQPAQIIERSAEGQAKMIEVLHVARDVELWRKAGLPPEVVGVLSYDEKPGIQAISNTAPDLPPVPGRHTSVGRDHEYKRHGTVSLLAGIELLSGEVLVLVRDRHPSAEFTEFLHFADRHYAACLRIRIVMDNHS